MDLIKLEFDNNIFRLPRAPTLADFTAKLSAKFGGDQVRGRCLCYRDEDGDFIALESEADWKTALGTAPKVDRFFLRAARPISEGCENAVGQDTVAACAAALDAHLDGELLEKVEKRIGSGQLPCSICMTDANRSSTCVRCRDGKKRGKPLSKVWRSVLLIIDAKMKSLLCDSMLEFFSGKEVSFKDAIKEEHQEKNSTNVSILLHKTEPTALYKMLDQKRFHNELFNQSSLSSLKLTESHIHPVNSHCQADSSSIEKSINEKPKGPKKHSFFGMQTVRLESSKKWANSSFPDCLLSSKQDSTEDRRFFSKEELKFAILEHEAMINKSGAVEVRMLVENRGEKHWPENVRVKLIDCAAARDVSVGLQKRLRMQSTLGVKFCFPVKPEVLSNGLDNLNFEFAAVDEEKNVKYYSKVFTVPIVGCKMPHKLILNTSTC